MTSTGVKTGLTIDHFYIEGKLGEGGMGAVYLGQDLTLSRRVAIKFLNRRQLVQEGNQAMREDMERRFIREAQSAAAINHPNLAQIYEANFNSDTWYIAMEYIDGASLFDQLSNGRRFSVDEIVDICRQTVSGLDFAWGKYKIIHRDIKPHNIMLTNENQVKIVDLGLAKPLNADLDDTELPDLTIAGTPIGTPQYMAPEQAAGKNDVNHLADIYALGATLYEISSGEKVFNEKTAPMIYMAQLQKKYRPLRELNNELPDTLARLIESMLEPKLEDRVSSYKDILMVLNECAHTTTRVVENEISKSSTFLCPHCSLELSVGQEYIGNDIECPECQSVFEVPDFRETNSRAQIPHSQDANLGSLKIESTKSIFPANAFILETFSEAETTLLQQEFGIDLKGVENLKRNQCWEFGLVAEILSHQISEFPDPELLHQSKVVIQNGLKHDRKKYYSFVREHFNEFFVLLKELYGLMSKELGYVLGEDDLNIIFSFAKKSRNLLISFREFQDRVLKEPVPLDRLYIDLQRVMTDRVPKPLNRMLRSKRSLPKQDQHLELHGLLCGWVPYCHECLNDIIIYLRANSKQERNSANYELPASLVPPTLNYFSTLAKDLNIGFSTFKSVKANLLKE